MPLVRFDDLSRGTEHSFELRGLIGAYVATHLDEVEGAVRAAQEAAARGSWVGGFVSYEAAPAFDPALPVRRPDPNVPLAWFGVFEEHEKVAGPARGGAYRIDAWVPSVDEEAYGSAIGEIRRRIGLGDTYQLNYTFRLRSHITGDPTAFYADLIEAQRGAFGAYLDTGDLIVASASPELFFELSNGRLTTRPMKGTAPRGRWPEEDEAMSSALARSEKDRAENLIIVDLLRNDLGRVSEFGSVQVESLFQLEQYETVWQMTSTIASMVRPGTDLTDVFRALFPCGSVTGAPKPRTMEIITNLEAEPRGVYCGAIGYIEPGGNRAVFSVPIRTVTIESATGVAGYGVGGGITWDSTSAGEHAEAVAKSRVLTTSRPPFRLLETLLWDGADYLEKARHLERLGASATYFGYRCDLSDADRLLQETGREAGSRAVRVRMTLARTGEMEVSAHPLPASDAPVVLAIDDVPVDSADPMLFHKTDARQHYDESMARHPGADDVILINERGEVTETTIANLVVRLGDHWATPPLDSGCLPGVYRDKLLEEGTITERVLTPGDLLAAEELAVINSVRLWRSARLG